MRSLLGGIAQAINKAPPYVAAGTRLSMPLFGRNGAEQQMRAMGSVGTLFSIVNRTSTALSALNWRLYRRAASGRKEDRTEVTSHAALDRWNKPNDFYTRQELVESVQQHIDLTGEGWVVISRNPRAPIPLELWPVRPDRMEPVPSPTEFLLGYIYRGPNGEEIPLNLDEVMMMRMPNPLDPYRGMGPVQSILTDLDSVRFSAEWNRNFFMNSAEPGGVIEVDKRLSDDEFDEMSTRWAEQHRGVANAHRVAIVEQGGKWVDRKYTMRDMQFVELRGVSSAVIREAFGMPKFALGDVDDVNRATADASADWFAAQLTVPRADRWKGMLNNDFLPLYGETARGLEFDYDSPVRPDREAEDRERESKANSAGVLVTAGWEPADVLAEVGLSPMRYIGTASTTTPPPVGAPAGPVALLPRPVRRALPRALDEEEREQWEDELDQLVADWQDDITPGQVDEAAEQVEAVVDAGDLEALADLDIGSEVAAALLAAVMIAVAVGAAQDVLDEAAAAGVKPPDVTVDEDALQQQATVRSALMARSLAETVGREAVRVATPGVSGAEVAAAVRSHVAGMSDRWLEDQLGGAVWHGVHEGRFTAFGALENVRGATLTFVANEKRDRNTCRPCRKISGREYESLEAARVDYPTSGYRDCDGGVRCRGTVDAVWVVD